MRSKAIFSLLSFLTLTFSAFSQQNPETITITTYYPAPFGIYQNLQLYPTNPAPDTCALATDLGKMYYDSSTYQLMLCQQDSTGNINWQNIGAGYWTLNGTNLYPNNNNWNVGIGTTTPQAKLDVAGEAKIGISSPALSCNPNTAGAMRYNSGKIEYCNGANWVGIGAGGSRNIYLCPVKTAPDSECTSHCNGQLTTSSTCTYWYDNGTNAPWACYGSATENCTLVGQLF